ncbi:hypothetical protein HK098_004612 [Nowakowskiella sp. JEL0407]|nr:hypothetical protein HK098_004612 [Nowakowskiella sp. JEL0407]
MSNKIYSPAIYFDDPDSESSKVFPFSGPSVGAHSLIKLTPDFPPMNSPVKRIEQQSLIWKNISDDNLSQISSLSSLENATISKFDKLPNLSNSNPKLNITMLQENARLRQSNQLQKSVDISSSSVLDSSFSESKLDTNDWSSFLSSDAGPVSMISPSVKLHAAKNKPKSPKPTKNKNITRDETTISESITKNSTLSHPSPKLLIPEIKVSQNPHEWKPITTVASKYIQTDPGGEDERIARMKVELESFDSEREMLLKELNDLKRSKESLEKDVAVLRKERLNDESKRTDLERRVEELVDVNKNAQTRILDLMKEKNKFEEQLLSKSKEKSRLERLISTSSSSSLKQQLSLSQSLYETKHELQLMEEIHQQQKEKMATMLNADKKIKEALLHEKEEKAVLGRKVDELQKIFEIQKIDLQQKGEEIRNMIDSHRIVSKANEDTINHLKSTIDKVLLNKSNTELTYSYPKLPESDLKQYPSSNHKITALEAQIQTYRDRYESDIVVLQHIVAEYKSKNAKLEKQLQYASANSRSDEEWAELMSRICVAENDLNEYTSKLSLKQNQIDSLYETIIDMNNEAKVLKADFKRVKDMYTKQRVELFQKDSILRDVTLKHTEALENISKLELKLKTLSATLSSKQNLVVSLKSTLSQERSKIADIEANTGNHEEQQQVRTLKERTERCSALAKFWKFKFEALQRDLQLKPTDPGIPTKKYSILSSKNRSLKSELEKVNKELEYFKGLVFDLKGVIKLKEEKERKWNAEREALTTKNRNKVGLDVLLGARNSGSIDLDMDQETLEKAKELSKQIPKTGAPAFRPPSKSKLLRFRNGSRSRSQLTPVKLPTQTPPRNKDKNSAEMSVFITIRFGFDRAIVSGARQICDFGSNFSANVGVDDTREILTDNNMTPRNIRVRNDIFGDVISKTKNSFFRATRFSTKKKLMEENDETDLFPNYSNFKNVRAILSRSKSSSDTSSISHLDAYHQILGLSQFHHENPVSMKKSIGRISNGFISILKSRGIQKAKVVFEEGVWLCERNSLYLVEDGTGNAFANRDKNTKNDGESVSASWSLESEGTTIGIRQLYQILNQPIPEGCKGLRMKEYMVYAYLKRLGYSMEFKTSSTQDIAKYDRNRLWVWLTNRLNGNYRQIRKWITKKLFFLGLHWFGNETEIFACLSLSKFGKPSTKMVNSTPRFVVCKPGKKVPSLVVFVVNAEDKISFESLFDDTLKDMEIKLAIVDNSCRVTFCNIKY